MVYWANKHQCVSCQYWKGRRETRSDSRVVECSPGTKGLCGGLNSRYKGKEVDCSLYVGGEKCFKRWSKLTE